MSPIYIHSCPVYGRRQKMKRQNKKISKEEEETNNKKINMRSIIHGRCRLSFFISFFQKTRTAAWLFSCFLSDLWVMLGWHRSHILRLINLPPHLNSPCYTFEPSCRAQGDMCITYAKEYHVHICMYTCLLHNLI
jgi:hypothetical protein